MLSSQFSTVMFFSALRSALWSTIFITWSAVQPVQAELTNWSGYVVDRPCSAEYKHDLKDSKAVLNKVKEHSKICDLSKECSEAGYSLYSNGEWIDFDLSSNELVKKAIEAGKRDKDIYVVVTGSLNRHQIHAVTVKEETPPR